MSRIELAMEKAALLRQGTDTTAPDQQAELRPQERRSVPAATLHRAFSSPRRLSPSNPLLVSLNDPHSAIAEEYRKLKSSLVKMTRGEPGCNTLAITSSLPNEGKSLTAINLAVSLAQELDHTVLLIDADLRRPSLHRYFEIEQEPGLADVLVGEAEVGETLVPTGIGKLTLMRAGRQVDNPSELFSSQRMADLLHEVKSRYPDRYVMFDTPPVLPFAETRSLASIVDGVLFVVMERLAPQESVRDALDSLKGCSLLGLVYNAAALSGSDERYSYYRSYDRS